MATILQYEDEDNDKIVLASDSDLQAAVYHARLAGWKVLIFSLWYYILCLKRNICHLLLRKLCQSLVFISILLFILLDKLPMFFLLPLSATHNRKHTNKFGDWQGIRLHLDYLGTSPHRRRGSISGSLEYAQADASAPAYSAVAAGAAIVAVLSVYAFLRRARNW